MAKVDISVASDILKVVEAVKSVKNFGNQVANDLDLFDKEAKSSPSKTSNDLVWLDEVQEACLSVVDDIKSKIRQQKNKKVSKKYQEAHQRMKNKYVEQKNIGQSAELSPESNGKVSALAIHSMLIPAVNQHELSPVDLVPFPEFQEMADILVIIGEGKNKSIEKRNVSIPQNFGGLSIKQPLTEEQFEVLSSFSILNSLNKRLQRPHTFYLLKEADKNYDELSRQLIELRSQFDKVKNKRIVDREEDIRTDNDTTRQQFLDEVRAITSQLAVVVPKHQEAIVNYNKLDGELSKSLPMPKLLGRDDIPVDLAVSSYHIDALAHGECSAEQAIEYQNLSDQQLIETRNKLKKEQEDIQFFLDSLSIMSEKNNPFDLADEKKSPKKSSQSISDELVQLATATERKNYYDYAIGKLVPQFKQSVSTANLLFNIEMAHRYNQNNHEQPGIFQSRETNRQRDAFQKARKRAENMGARVVLPTQKEALINKIDSEIKVLESKKNKFGFRMLSSLTSKQSILFPFVPNALSTHVLRKKISLQEQERKLRDIKQTITVATKKTPVIQSLLGESILNDAEIRNRFLVALTKNSYSTGIKGNDKKLLLELRSSLQNRNANPILIDGQISNFVAKCDTEDLRHYFEKLIDGMIAEIKAENAKLSRISKFLSNRNSKDGALIQRLLALKTQLVGSNNLLLMSQSHKVTKADFDEKNLVILQPSVSNKAVVTASFMKDNQIETRELSQDVLKNIPTGSLSFPSGKKQLPRKILHSRNPNLVDNISQQLDGFQPTVAGETLDLNDKNLTYIEIYLTPEMRTLFKEFNFLRRPGTDAIISFENEPSSPLYKLLRRTSDIQGRYPLFKEAFLNLFSVPGINAEAAILHLLTTQNYQHLDKVIRDVNKKLLKGHYQPQFSADPQLKASFEYLVKQLLASVRIGLSTSQIDSYDRQKRVGDIKVIRRSGRLEAESLLMDMIFDHPGNSQNEQKLLAEISYVRKVLSEETGPKIDRIRHALSLLESFVTGKRQTLLSDDEKSILQQVFPSYRLSHTHFGTQYTNQKLENYLVANYIQPKFKPLYAQYKRTIANNSSVILNAGDDFKRLSAYGNLIKEYAFDEQYQQNIWFSRDRQSIANVLPGFKSIFLSGNDISEQQLLDASGAYLRTANNPTANIRFHFYINFHLFGLTSALSQRLVQYGFPEQQIDLVLSKDKQVIDSLRDNNDVYAFVKSKIDQLSELVLTKFVNEGETPAEKRTILLEQFFDTEHQFFNSQLDSEGTDYPEWSDFINLQGLVFAAAEDCQELVDRCKEKKIEPFPPFGEDPAFIFNAVNKKRGLLICNIGTKRQSAEYLKRRLPLVVLGDRILAEQEDEQFLEHPAILNNEYCKILIDSTVRRFVNNVKEFPSTHSESDKTEDFIRKFAPQHLVKYQSKRLITLLAEIIAAHDILCLSQVNKQNKLDIQRAQYDLRLAFDAFAKYWNSDSLKCKSDSLLNAEDAKNERANVISVIKGLVDVQGVNNNLISLENFREDVVFNNYLGNYRIFPVPGQNDHAKLGQAVEWLVKSPQLYDNEIELDHIIHKLSTLLEMSFLFDKDKKDINLMSDEYIISGNEVSLTGCLININDKEYSLDSILGYIESLPTNLKENALFVEKFVDALARHLEQLEQGKRPFSTTAAHFFHYFATQDQCDRFHLCYVRDLLKRGERLRNEVFDSKSIFEIDKQILEELNEFMREASKTRSNRYQPGFDASNFIRAPFHRATLDNLLQAYLDERIPRVSLPETEIPQHVNGIDLINEDEQKNLDDILEQLEPNQQRNQENIQLDTSVSQSEDIAYQKLSYAPINTMVWRVGEEIASEKHVRNTRFDLLEKYLRRSPNLLVETAEQFIENFVNKPLAEMINSPQADEFSLAYIKAIEDGNADNYSVEAQQAAERLIAFFSPALLNQLLYAKLKNMFMNGVHTAFDLAGGAVVTILHGLQQILAWAGKLLMSILEQAQAGIEHSLAILKDKLSSIKFPKFDIPGVEFPEITLPELDINAIAEKFTSALHAADHDLEIAAKQFLQWLSTSAGFREKQNFLLNYLCQGFVEADADLNTSVNHDLTGENGYLRALLASQTFERLGNKIPKADLLTRLLLGQGVQPNAETPLIRCKVNFDRLEKTTEELQNTFAWFCALDPVNGYYPSCFVLLHLAQLCQHDVDNDKQVERITNLLWMQEYEYQASVNHSDRQKLTFRHRDEVDSLFRASAFFADDAAYDEHIARVIDAYASAEVADEYRLKKIRDLIQEYEQEYESVGVNEANNIIIKVEKFINELAGDKKFYSYMETPRGNQLLSHLLDSYINPQAKWSPVVSMFIDAFTQDEQLKQKNNLSRLKGVVRKYNGYNALLNVDCQGVSRVIRDDYDVFESFLGASDTSIAAVEIGRLFGAEDTTNQQLINLLDDLLFHYLPANGLNAELEKWASRQLAATKSVQSRYPDYFLNALSKSFNDLIINLDLGKDIGFNLLENAQDDHERAKLNINGSDKTKFFHQLLDQLRVYFKEVDVSHLDDALAIKLQKIRLLVAAFDEQKALYRANSSQQHDQLSLVNNETDLGGYLQPLYNEVALLTDNGGGDSDARWDQLQAEKRAQAYLSGMHDRVVQQINLTIAGELAPFQTIKVDEQEEQDQVTLKKLDNKLTEFSNELSCLSYDVSGKTGSFTACETLFTKIGQFFAEIQNLIEDAPFTLRHLSKFGEQVNKVAHQIQFTYHQDSIGKTTELRLNELSPILMLPILNKSYGKIIFKEDESKLVEYIKSYTDALSRLHTSRDLSLDAKNKLILQMLDAFIDIVSFHIEDVDMVNLKELLRTHYAGSSKKMPMMTGTNKGLETILHNIHILYKERVKQPNSEMLGNDIASIIRVGVAKFSIYRGCYKDMQNGIETRLIHTTKSIFNHINVNNSAKLSNDSVIALSKNLGGVKQRYTAQYSKNLSKQQITKIEEQLKNSAQLKSLVGHFLKQIHDMKEALSASIASNSILPCFDMTMSELDLLYGSLNNKNRDTLADLLGNLLKLSSLDNDFFLTDELQRQLKKMSDWFRFKIEPTSEDRAAYEANRLATQERQQTYEAFVAFFNEPAKWTQASIQDIFTRLRHISDLQLTRLIDLQFESKLGNTRYEIEKRNNPHYMTYKALLKVKKLYFKESLDEQHIHAAVENVGKIQYIVSVENKLQELLPIVGENESDFASTFQEFRENLGIINSKELFDEQGDLKPDAKTCYQHPLNWVGIVADTQDLRAIGQVFCEDLLQEQLAVFSELHVCLEKLNQQVELKNKLNALQQSQNPNASKEINGLQEKIAAFEASPFDEQFRISYRRYKVISKVLDEIRNDNGHLANREEVLTHNIFLSGVIPVIVNPAELYLYWDQKDGGQLKYAFNDQEGRASHAIIHRDQLGSNYYDSLVAALKHLREHNALKCERANFDDNTLQALSYIIPAEYCQQYSFDGQWILSSNRRGGYNSQLHYPISVSASLSNTQAEIARILMNDFPKTYAATFTDETDADVIKKRLAFVKDLQEFDHLFYAEGVKNRSFASSAAVPQEDYIPVGSYSELGASRKQNQKLPPILRTTSTPVSIHQTRKNDEHKGIVSADPSLASKHHGNTLTSIAQSAETVTELKATFQSQPKSQRKQEDLAPKVLTKDNSEFLRQQDEILRLQQEMRETEEREEAERKLAEQQLTEAVVPVLNIDGVSIEIEWEEENSGEALVDSVEEDQNQEMENDPDNDIDFDTFAEKEYDTNYDSYSDTEDEEPLVVINDQDKDGGSNEKFIPESRASYGVTLEGSTTLNEYKNTVKSVSQSHRGASSFISTWKPENSEFLKQRELQKQLLQKEMEEERLQEEAEREVAANNPVSQSVPTQTVAGTPITRGFFSPGNIVSNKNYSPQQNNVPDFEKIGSPVSNDVKNSVSSSVARSLHSTFKSPLTPIGNDLDLGKVEKPTIDSDSDTDSDNDLDFETLSFS